MSLKQKEILVYITHEGRYNREMIYHFNLMNHFTGRSSLNLPFYLHKSLTKMAHQVKAHPTKIAGRLSHHGLIQLIVQELLQKDKCSMGIFFYFGMSLKQACSQNRKESRLQINPPPLGVEKGRGGLSHQ